MNYTLVFLDTETTGNTENDYLCQIAYKVKDEMFVELYKPPVKIPPEASAVSHITNKMVADKAVFKESKDYAVIKTLLEDESSILVAHNAKFDVGMLHREDISPKKVICTLRVARYVDKENKIPRYNLQYLRYFLEMEIEAQAHDAKGDVLVLEQLFPRLYDAVKKDIGTEDETQILEEMIRISSLPSIVQTFMFGKYNGRRIAEIAHEDSKYLEWLLNAKLQNATADDEDIIYTLKFYLGKL